MSTLSSVPVPSRPRVAEAVKCYDRWAIWLMAKKCCTLIHREITWVVDRQFVQFEGHFSAWLVSSAYCRWQIFTSDISLRSMSAQLFTP